MIAWIKRQWGWIVLTVIGLATYLAHTWRRDRAWRRAVEAARARDAANAIVEAETLAKASADADAEFRKRSAHIAESQAVRVSQVHWIDSDEAIRRLMEGIDE